MTAGGRRRKRATLVTTGLDPVSMLKCGMQKRQSLRAEAQASPPTLTPPHHALCTWAGGARSLHSSACRGAAQPVVDGFAQPVVRDRHHCDAIGAGGIEGAPMRKQIRR